MTGIFGTLGAVTGGGASAGGVTGGKVTAGIFGVTVGARNTASAGVLITPTFGAVTVVVAAGTAFLATSGELFKHSLR